MAVSTRQKEALVALSVLGTVAGGLGLLARGHPAAAAGPPVPTGLAASNLTASEVYLTWNESAGATGYVIAYASSPAGPFADVATPVGTCALIGGLTPGSSASFTVAATAGSARSAASAVLTITVPLS